MSPFAARQHAYRSWLSVGLLLTAGISTAADYEFFERRIRPVLVAECYKCHAGEDAEGGLRVDHREGLLQGGEDAAVIPGDPSKGRLLKALRHELPDLKMPKAGARLDDSTIADFARWIQAGAPDPRIEPAAGPVPDVSWETTRDFRRQWWSFQPVKEPEIPLAGNNWSSHPVDRFLLAGMRGRGLEPASPAARQQVVRRIYFALTGLPPKPEQMTSALAGSHASLVDELLASARFGERWARHWMDWFRYAESHGSEGDPAIPHAYRYRDYLIRAFNADVPYDQLVREHLAGDLLAKPRINRELGLNESAIGVAHYRFVQHGYQPTEPMMELVRFVDDQIDVVSKAFLGLTVSCARCHNHKFDPISQQDYYALFGIMRSSMPGIITVDAPGRMDRHRERLGELKDKIREAVADEWLRFADQVPGLLQSTPGLIEKLKLSAPPDGGHVQKWRSAIRSATSGNRGNPFIVWNALKGGRGADFAAGWQELQEEQRTKFEAASSELDEKFRLAWNPTTIQSEWHAHGDAWKEGVVGAGEFFISPGGDEIIRAIYPRGLFSHRITSKHGGVLTSPKFKVTGKSVSVRLMGHDAAQARLVVANYPVARGGIYGQRSQPDHENFVWYKWDTTYWEGEEAHIEIATQDDLMIFLRANRGAKNPDLKDGRSYIGVSEVVFNDGGQEAPPEKFSEVYEILRRGAPNDARELAWHYRDVLKNAVTAWKTRHLDDYQALLLNFLVQAGLLPNTSGELVAAQEFVGEYRRLEAEIPIATRSSGVLETVGRDQPLLERGDYRKPTDLVARRFLEVFDGRKYPGKLSGRLELAADILQPDNPLVPRVLVNRVWAYLFGEALVPSVDNFGRLGRKPSHPELLDHLAGWFVENGYSLKKLIGYLAKTRAYQLGSRPSRRALEVDPGNERLSHFTIQRLDAEAIRDAVLAVSGRLELDMYGPSVAGAAPRRSIYVRSPRNNRDEFLKTFDAPEPLSTRGRRDVTNVPAQSLALLNDPDIKKSSQALGDLLAAEAAPDAEKVRRLFRAALGREPTVAEIEAAAAMRRNLLAEGDVRMEAARKMSLELDRLGEEIEVLVGPARKRILARRTKSGAPPVRGPVPYALWDFEKDTNDSRLGLAGKLIGNARIEGGALIVDGEGSYAVSGTLSRTIKAKTLEAWVQLDNLDQRGGGVMSIQTPDGVHFDAIVIGEREPRKWMAGSNGFRRTRSFGGEVDAEAAHRPVHLAIVYSADGQIAAYRDGSAYGEPYQSDGPRTFNGRSTVVAFGLRHLPASGNRMLAGRIFEARLYDRALTPVEIAASAGQITDYVSEGDLLAALDGDSRKRVQELKLRVAVGEGAVRKLNESPAPTEKAVWAELAHAVFNLKEFIYLR